MTIERRNIQDWIDPPEPEQLFQVAGVMAGAARAQESLRPGRSYKNAQFMFLEPVEVSYVGDLSQQLEGVERKVRGYIRRIPPAKEDPRLKWSFRLRDTEWTTHTPASEARGVSATYSFVWSEHDTLMALRRVRQLPTEDIRSLDDMLDSAYLRDDEVSIAVAEQEMSSVSRADCEVLEASLRDLSQRSIELYQMSHGSEGR